MKYQLAASALGTSLMLVDIGPAFAQLGTTDSTTLEEIVVTAEKRVEDLQKVPASITVISGEELIDSGRATGGNFIYEALQDVPGVTVQDQHITIRGITSSDAADGFQPATAVYVDGVFSPLGGGRGGTAIEGVVGGSDFGETGGNLDTERVEVLRGPQGTLFGRSATGGVVNIITKDPTQDFEAVGTMEFGNYELRHFGGALNLPVAPGLSFRAAVDSVNQDGYLSNGQNDDHDQQLRLKGLYQTDRFSVMAAYYYEQYANGFGQGTVLPFINTPPQQEWYQTLTSATYNAANNLWEAYGRVEVDLGFATVTLIPSYTKQSNPQTTSPVLTFTQINTAPAINSTYDELRLASEAGSKLTWVVGGNFYKLLSETTSNFYAGPVLILGQVSNISAKSWGFFGQTTYSITDRLRATAGLRYTKEEQADRESGLAPDPITGLLTPYDHGASPVFTSTNYKARLDYDLRPKSLLYASVSTGFLPGGIASTGIVPFAAQTVTSYEVGSKNRFLGDRLQLNGSVFFYNYPNLQGTSIEFVGTAPVSTIILNNPAQYKGGELEGLFQVTKDDKASLSVAYLDAHYTSLTPYAQSVFGGTQLASAPRWEVAGVFDHRFRLPGGASLTPEARANYQSATYVSQSVEPYALQNSYTLVSLSLNLASTDGKYGLTGYVRNLTNVYYKTAGILAAGQSLASQGLFVGIPRTYGFVLNARF